MKRSHRMLLYFWIEIGSAMVNLIYFAAYPNWFSLIAGGIILAFTFPTYRWYREVRGYEHEA